MERTIQQPMRIGIMDSGIGGFSILAEIHSLLPHLKFYYYADDHNAPYGNLTSDQVVLHTRKAVESLLAEGVDLIVLACNSATAVAIDQMRSEFKIPFVGVEPYVNVIHKESLCLDQHCVGILTTTMTGESHRFKDLLRRFDPENKLLSFKSPLLAKLIEELHRSGWSEELEDQVRAELSFVSEAKLTHLILGCTHYPLIRDFLVREFEVEMISPCPYVAKRVKELLSVTDDTSKKVTSFNFYSSQKESWQEQNFSTLLGALQPLPEKV